MYTIKDTDMESLRQAYTRADLKRARLVTKNPNAIHVEFDALFDIVDTILFGAKQIREV